MSASTTCTICQTKLQGDYCSSCGQRYLGRRVNAWDVIGGWLSGLLLPERSLLGTFRQLLVNPRYIINNYWSGFRGYYLSPSQLVVYMLFVFGLHLALVNQEILGITVNVSGVSDSLKSFLSPQLFLFLLMIPMLGLSTAAVYYRHKHSFPEHFTAAIYLFALWAILFTLLTDTLYLLLGMELGSLPFWFFGAVFLWSARVFSPEGSAWYRVLLNAVLAILMLAFIFAILLGIAYLLDPEGAIEQG
jgi:uncharacterized membrane protein